MKVLVDSSVWVAHFKQRNERLVALLEDGQVVCHPFIVAEIACGTPPARKSVIDCLSALEMVPVATQAEFLYLLDSRALYGRGCGVVDISLLASVLLAPGTHLWTLDKRLEALVIASGRAYLPVFNA